MGRRVDARYEMTSLPKEAQDAYSQWRMSHLSDLEAASKGTSPGMLTKLGNIPSNISLWLNLNSARGGAAANEALGNMWDNYDKELERALEYSKAKPNQRYEPEASWSSWKNIKD